MRQQQQQLLQQGISEYADANNAVKTFEALAIGTWRDVVEKNLQNFANALRIQIPKLEDYRWPKRYADGDGAHFELGINFVHKDENISWAWFGHAFCWWRGEEDDFETSIYVGVECPDTDQDHLKTSLGGNAKKDDGPCVYLGELIRPGDGKEIDAKLNKLMQEWIDLWRKVGGIKALAVDSSGEEEPLDGARSTV